MAQHHAIELALDLARMPALARTSSHLPFPRILSTSCVSSGLSRSVRAAVATTGESTSVVIDAARFYLQHVLFRPEADCYRILGIEPVASRATARSHMRWLLEWLHPDRNNNSWDAVYAERVLRAWREVSANNGPLGVTLSRAHPPKRKKNGDIGAIWRPWIESSSNADRQLSEGLTARLYYGPCHPDC